MRPIILPWLAWAFVPVTCITLALAISGCAEDRFLSKEEDEEMRQACAQGCIAVHYPQWMLIKRALGLTDL